MTWSPGINAHPESCREEPTSANRYNTSHLSGSQTVKHFSSAKHLETLKLLKTRAFKSKFIIWVQELLCWQKGFFCCMSLVASQHGGVALGGKGGWGWRRGVGGWQGPYNGLHHWKHLELWRQIIVMFQAGVWPQHSARFSVTKEEVAEVSHRCLLSDSREPWS